ncbi:hypothetical protein ACFFUE_02870 [Bergeyella porcorum]|uniref:hypothetical protein n=1 Tax=Bergeyella porcorum TaxID=1735111 RepID=UPI0035EA9E97
MKNRKNRSKYIEIVALFLAGATLAYISPTIFGFGEEKLETREIRGSVATIIACLLTSIAMFLEYFKKDQTK